MHGVAHLVDEGKHAVEVILVVEQHVGVGPAVAGAVGELPALRAEVTAAATPATPCLYPAFSFVLQKSAENGSHPASILWLGLGLASSRKGAHKAFRRP